MVYITHESYRVAYNILRTKVNCKKLSVKQRSTKLLLGVSSEIEKSCAQGYLRLVYGIDDIGLLSISTEKQKNVVPNVEYFDNCTNNVSLKSI